MTHNHSKKNHHEKQDGEKRMEDGAKPEVMSPEPKPGSKVEVDAQEYEALKKRVAELEGLREKLLLSAADYENAKKRNAREKEDFIRFSQERILREILPVLDNFERAVNHAGEASLKASGEEELRQNLKTLIEGVERVEKQLFDVLRMHGLKRIDTKAQLFDPHFHEAVAHVAEEGKEDHIVDELESGYMLHDRLLRAAKVRVRVAPQQAPAAEEKKEENL